jgi:hypothetical protein
MKAKSIIGASPEEIRVGIEKSLADGFRPTLAIVFMSVKQDRKAVCSILSDYNIQVFGSTTAGEFIDSEISEGGIAIMLMDMNPDHFKIVFYDIALTSEYESARQLGAEGKKLFLKPAFVIATAWMWENKQPDYEKIIQGIEDGFGGESVIFGGVAGDELTLVGPIVFNNDHGSLSGLLALIIDEDKVEVTGTATCGWKPIGITKTITKSEGNIVYTIDDQPALDLVVRYLGIDIENLRTIAGSVVDIGAYYPWQLERNDAPPVMRTAQLGNLEDRSLICAGKVPQGARVRFSLPPDFDVIDTVVEECKTAKENSSQDADAVIMFSCIARYISFGALASEELERVKNIWEAPFIGFFSYGEFGKSGKGKHEFHNNTCCVVALKEKY